jgi:YVTN family beta-propeller protein
VREILARGAALYAAPLGLAIAFIALAPRVAEASNTLGAWSPVTPWPMVAVHVALMPDGRVLTYGTQSSDYYDIWDPVMGLGNGHLTLPNFTGTSPFCSSQLSLPEGEGILIVGGGLEASPNVETSVVNYDPGLERMTLDGNMARPRWYGSSTTLLSGETYIQGGTGGFDRPEVRDSDGGFHLLSGADTSALDFYFPRIFSAPDGRVFGYDTTGAMFYINATGSGSLTRTGQFTGPKGTASSAAMYRPGRILQFGGASNGALTIDITSGTPVVKSTQAMSTRRRWVNATILANGTVLATGGTDTKNELSGTNYRAEIWNPDTGRWTLGASGDRARLYHSAALLLPDASVLVAGGGNPGPQFNDNVEIYYPPYLYDASGGWAARPTIDSAPSAIDIGETFPVEVAETDDIRRVVMVKTGAASHSFNFDQRFVELAFHRVDDVLMVQAPPRAGDAPPGFYLLFTLNAAGTPSNARIARVAIAPVPNPAVVPNLVNPGSQSAAMGLEASLQLAATDPNGDILSYSATGLPPGLDIDPATGAISGSPSAVGTFNVEAVVTDGINEDHESFQWIVTQSGFVLLPPPPVDPVLADSVVTLQAESSGGTGVQYRWDFDDGTPETEYSESASIDHTFDEPGIYYVTVTAIDESGVPQSTTIVVTVHLPLTANPAVASTNLVIEDRVAASDRLWVVNQDNDSVSVFDTTTRTRLGEINVGTAPRSIAIAPSGEVWVTNKRSATISVINPATLAVARTTTLPFASQPFGVVASPTGDAMYVALEATGRVLKLNPADGSTIGSLTVGPNPRHLSVTANGGRLYVSRFITPSLPGESTAAVLTDGGGGEVDVIDAAAMSLLRTITLRHSDKPDFENQGRGIPNYLGAVAISPDGQSAWVPSKQDNIARGTLRDLTGLTFQNSVRAISSRIDLAGQTEDYPDRIDHDNSGVASAILHDRLGVYMFVALETSREIAVVDAHGAWEIFRFATGRAPQGLALSVDGRTLYVNNFMDRTVTAFDISTLLRDGIANVPVLATMSAVSSEKLTAQVLKGKQFFYDAKDLRLARDAYISCASCHNDGDDDGRVWDFTGFGEGLRNTIRLRGRGGAQGFLHWSNNFNEVQDFEGQIRAFAAGTGLMTTTEFNTGTRSQPLGDAKAGVNADLDALAAYVASLNTFASSPLRNNDGSLTAAAVSGREVFRTKNCASCHAGTAFTNSGNNNPANIGTLKVPESGKRLNDTLSGIDVPTLRDVWATAPYLHRGSAATLADAIRAHTNVSVTDAQLVDLVAYVAQIGNQESSAPVVTASPNTGTGLAGQYFNNTTLSGAPVLQRTEAVNFSWSTSPGTGVNSDQFSVRWTGQVEAASSGNYQFQTVSNDGVRLWVNGVLLINNWTTHSTATDTSAVIAVTKNQRYSVTMEFFDANGSAVARLRWKKPGDTSFPPIPATRLYPN